MARCKICPSSSSFISAEMGVCLGCIRNHPEDALHLAMNAHKRSRAAFRLPEEPPRDPQGLPCHICANECRIPPGKKGYCGIRENRNGKLTGVSSKEGKLSWYHDPLPTNCVGDWVCPGGIGSGYPKYANCAGSERGYKNLAVFFQACPFNCLYCQNWHFRDETFLPGTKNAEDLVSGIDEKSPASATSAATQHPSCRSPLRRPGWRWRGTRAEF